MANAYPFPAFHFRVDFLFSSAPVEGRFARVRGLKAELRYQSFPESGQSNAPRQLLTGVDYGDLVLERGFIDSDAIFQWFQKCIDDMAVVTVPVTVALLNDKHQVVFSWMCENAYPLSWALGDFDAMSPNRYLLETLVLRYQSCKLVPQT